MTEKYAQQVRLLLDVMPEIAKERCFSLHGGTAINLFVLNMPRLSVDIDLTYVHIQDRQKSIDAINGALQQISARVIALRPSLRVEHKDKICKLLIEEYGVQIKVEVNMVGRGVIETAENKMPLCELAQEKFDVFCAINVVPLAQLYGGKICAALDRQHPRDLFDVYLLLKENNYSDEIKRGFIYSLACSNRPTHEMLDPNLIDQRSTFDNQFKGMSPIEFTYDDFEKTRLDLIKTIRENLDDNDKRFLLSLNNLEPDWSIYNFEQYPSVKWKLLNLKKFRDTRPDDHQLHMKLLEKVLNVQN
ncbi:nucleotidyl transferase AbiEii/AbiGii toxin family protein [Shewanella marisflavi]|uniref:Nucleotidyltransferase n=1 Tax=Shewanella marisflavi TaxID=260364 RepID=A0AAC9U1Q6_9GAMM|nr:nucleotidyl transferase AbiEii/AbiGii toxin family protein [Shewanella marisflavi]ASJ97683.1 nucleotidyltransferase [Shewanella marisflavi]